jgi:hypothetical protein
VLDETKRTKGQYPRLLPEAAAGARPGHAGRAARSGRTAAAGTGDQTALDVREVRPPRVVTFGQVPQSFLFGSISGSWVAFALFGGMAVFFGVATTRILGRFAAPNGSAPYYGTTPIARRVVGALVGGGMLVAVWWWLWSGFYLLEVGRDLVTLDYHGPPRRYALPKAEIVAARWESGPKASRVLVVETRSGKLYRSTQTSVNEAFERRVTQAVVSKPGAAADH